MNTPPPTVLSNEPSVLSTEQPTGFVWRSDLPNLSMLPPAFPLPHSILEFARLVEGSEAEFEGWDSFSDSTPSLWSAVQGFSGFEIVKDFIPPAIRDRTSGSKKNRPHAVQEAHLKTVIYLHLLGLRGATYCNTGQWEAPVSCPKKACTLGNFVVQCASSTTKHNQEACVVLLDHFTDFIQAGFWKIFTIGRTPEDAVNRLRKIFQECLDMQMALQSAVQMEEPSRDDIHRFDQERRLARRTAKWMTLCQIAHWTNKKSLTRLIAKGGADICSSDDSEDDQNNNEINQEFRRRRRGLIRKKLSWRENSLLCKDFIDVARKEHLYFEDGSTRGSSTSWSQRLPPKGFPSVFINTRWFTDYCNGYIMEIDTP